MSKTVEKRQWKAMYRTSWEKNPMLRDWIQSVPGKSDKAFCRFCQRSLYAHRYSVLKHTCTIKHQQNADKFKGKVPNGVVQIAAVQANVSDEIANDDKNEPAVTSEKDEGNDMSGLESGAETFSAYLPDDEELTEGYLDEEDYIIEDDADELARCEEYEFVESDEVSSPTPIEANSMSMRKKLTISTHILDTSRGMAAADVPVTLFKMENNIWRQISQSVTNADGRVPSLVPSDEFTTGLYKLHFDTNEYFKKTYTRFMYPFVEICFNCDEVTHYHIPLLLNPFGYSTYRGT